MSAYRTRVISARDAESREERLENATKQLMQLAQQILQPNQTHTISSVIPQQTLESQPHFNNALKIKPESSTTTKALKVDQVDFLETNEEINEVFHVNITTIGQGKERKFGSNDVKASELNYDVTGGRQQLASNMTSQKVGNKNSMKNLHSMKESKLQRPKSQKSAEKGNSRSNSDSDSLKTNGKPKILKLKKKRKKTNKLAMVKKGDNLVSNRRKSEEPSSAPIVQKCMMPFARGPQMTSTAMPSMPMMIPAHLMHYPSMPMHISFHTSPKHMPQPQILPTLPNQWVKDLPQESLPSPGLQTPLLSGFETPLEAPLQMFPQLDPEPRSQLSPGVISMDRATVGKMHPHLVKTDNMGHWQVMGDNQVIPGNKKGKAKSSKRNSLNTKKR